MTGNYYSVNTLENIARNTIKQYDEYFLNFEPQAIPIERIIEDAYGLNIDFMRLTIAGNELGRMVCENGYSTRFAPDKDDYELVKVTEGTMLIESRLLEKPQYHGRYRFTLAHELAHWIIHKHLFKGTSTAAAHYKSDVRGLNTIEWQADYLAAAILMPAGLVKRAFHRVRNEKVDIIKKLAEIFEVSKQAMRIRLEELGLI